MGLVILVVFVLALLALLPSMIAQEKGRAMGPWYLYSYFLFPIALLHVFFLKTHEPMEKCPKCKKSVSQIALECPHCGYQFIRDFSV